MVDQIVKNRVDKNIAFAVDAGINDLEGIDRLAAKKLFSVLTDLETIAVLAAERGDGVAGQLEDEYVHYHSFNEIAKLLGGKEPIVPTVERLVKFLEGQKSDMSMLLLNVTAESWLEVFLHRLGRIGLCNNLFSEIEKDEARHAGLARKLPVPDPKLSAPLMGQLERHLVELMKEPEFVLPLTHFTGVNTAARTAYNILEAHGKACEHLGIEISDELKNEQFILWEALRTPEPKELDTNDWEKLRITLFSNQPGSMLAKVEVPWDKDMVDFEVALGKAVSYALKENPQTNRTVANNKLYQCLVPMVGFRRTDQQNRVYSIYKVSPHLFSEEVVKKDMRRSVAKTTQQPYCTLPNWRDYEGMVPPSRCAAMITHVGVYSGMGHGIAPLVHNEGISTILTTNNFVEVPRKRRWGLSVKWVRVVPVNIVFDHRAFDGADAGKFMASLTEWFEKEI